MSLLAQELKRLRFGLDGGAADDDFVARVMDGCDHRPRAAAARPPSRRKVWSYGAALAAAAGVAIAVSSWPPHQPQSEAQAGGTVAARGNLDQGLRATVQAFVGHASPGSAPALLDGARLRPGDGVLVRYSNPSIEDVYLMVFALDDHGAVHWLHPAYLSESTNPTSLKLARQVTQRVLPEVAEPEDAAAGPLRVYALLSRVALDVKSVESTLTSSRKTVPELFPQAEVEEWRCTWAP